MHPSPSEQLWWETSHRYLPFWSLPPFRGEVRWGVGRRAHTSHSLQHPNFATQPLLRHPVHSPPPPLPLYPLPPSCASPPINPPAHLHHPCASPPSFLRRQEPRAPHATPHPKHMRRWPPFRPPPSQKGRVPNSSLPPFRGEVRWGVGRREHHQPLSPTPQFAPLLRPPLSPPPPLRPPPPPRTLSATPIPLPPSLCLPSHQPTRSPPPPSVIPAQAGTTRTAPPRHPPPTH